MIDLIANPTGTLAALAGIIGAAIAAFFGLRAKWRREGRSAERQKTREADHERADDIRDRVGKTDRFTDPDRAREWMRDNGWGRDRDR